MPKNYITVDEFTNIVKRAMYDAGYFEQEREYHPEDIASTIGVVANSVALGMGYLISRNK
jgi:hypothetical protein